VTDLAARPATRTPARVDGSATHDRWRAIGLLTGLVAGLVVACLAAGALGAFPIAPADIAASVGRRLGLTTAAATDPTAEAVLWQIRFPRVVLGVVVGASLGVGGALLQGLFRNPLAEPGIIGVSAGAAVGAATAIVTGLSALGGGATAASAFVGGLVATLLVYAVARSGRRTEVVTLVLAGIAINAVAGAAIGLLMFLSTDAQVRAVAFWNLGSLGSATWGAVATVAPLAVLGLATAPWFARQLDLLALGEPVAGHLGVDVNRLRLLVIVVVAMLTAAAVAVAGVVSFVGLVVPHLIRLATGPGHRLLLPASALGGALLLVVADLVARTVAAPAEVPLGVLTALVGGPFFFWLLLRTRERQGGWA